MPTECSVCRKPLRRHKNDYENADTIPLIHTRTLWRGQFLPTCSEECADTIRPVPTPVHRKEIYDAIRAERAREAAEDEKGAA